jgi:cystathionine beta-lyase/cystathionine gamma-synthase
LLKSGKARYIYGQFGTPTRRGFEDAVCARSEVAYTVSLPSGLNAIATVILVVCLAGCLQYPEKQLPCFTFNARAAPGGWERAI